MQMPFPSCVTLIETVQISSEKMSSEPVQHRCLCKAQMHRGKALSITPEHALHRCCPQDTDGCCESIQHHFRACAAQTSVNDTDGYGKRIRNHSRACPKQTSLQHTDERGKSIRKPSRACSAQTPPQDTDECCTTIRHQSRACPAQTSLDDTDGCGESTRNHFRACLRHRNLWNHSRHRWIWQKH